MSTSSRFESSPFEPMPKEILDQISALLDIKSLKEFRFVTPKVNEGACKLLFSSITIQPLPESAVQLHQIIDSGFHKHVQQVRFDLSPLWLSYFLATRMDPDVLHKRIERLSIADNSDEKVTKLGSSHFGMPKFLEAFGQLTQVDKIAVTTANRTAPFLMPVTFDLTVIFFQILRLARRLPRPVKIFSVTTDTYRSLTFAIFDPRFPSSYPSPSSSLVSGGIASEEVSHCFELWKGIEKFEVELHPGRLPRSHMSAPLALSNTLHLMSQSLCQLSITIVGNPYRMAFSSSLLERGSSTDEILQGLRFPKLRELTLVNVGEPGPGLGDFISKHVGTLQSFKLEYLPRSDWVLPHEYLQALRDVLGDKMGILTLVCCGDLVGRNCRVRVCRDWPCAEDIEYEIRADQLAEMVIDRDLKPSAVLEAHGITTCQRPAGSRD